jgi:hypothetical protein
LFRCYLTRATRIVWGEDLDADTLDRACDEALEVVDHQKQVHCDGFEIWSRADLLMSVTLDEIWSHAVSEEQSLYHR